ncbi:transcriptional regulator [Flavobacterium cyanobacteriorum]|uniref:Transcriptional regulator n=1 Tax=Flavobacterium cyanobacteriorum TaxID=2022802 RepID=A0A255ZVM9_9FLAO|nr:metalloregulator ArsR/SmtB family transcription factor [Flavobacterium cyanobacteriorum]OYQ45496.1 transcriptional regulator [Flavobacterium cyanobacteriorum]
MGFTKSDLFTPEQNTVSLIFKALGHPARVAILDYLLKVGECICGDIVNELPLAQPTISRHLKELKNAGLIKGNIEGTAICYCISQEAVATIASYLDSILTQLNNNNNCC